MVPSVLAVGSRTAQLNLLFNFIPSLFIALIETAPGLRLYIIPTFSGFSLSTICSHHRWALSSSLGPTPRFTERVGSTLLSPCCWWEVLCWVGNGNVRP